MLEQAEQAYRAAVAAVEEARASWQGDTEGALDTFQEIAVARQPHTAALTALTLIIDIHNILEDT